MSYRFALLVVSLAAGMALSGCATKKHVRESLDPVNKQLGDLDKRNAENATAITALDEKTQRGISRVDEKASAADARAGDAAKEAAQAGKQAAQASEKADSARSLAESGSARAGRLEKVVESLDNYRVASSSTVYFDFNKSTLSEEARKELAALAQSAANARRYVIEVQGFTDSTGDAEYNYALSGKRAATVVRFFTTEQKIPVYRIHTLALGKDMPAEENKTSQGRKRNRRVEVKLYTPIQPAS